MPDRSMTYRLYGDDVSASKAVKGVGQEAERTGRKMNGLGTTSTRAFATIGKGFGGIGRIGIRTSAVLGTAFAGVAAAGVAAMGAIGKVGFGELKDASAGLAQTNAVLKSTKGVAKVTAREVDKLASSIQRYSGQTDDSIRTNANLLLTFTNVRNEAGRGNDIFSQAVKVFADMKQADPSASIKQLGKALNDPLKGITALTKVGVVFTDQQKKTIKSLVESGKTLDAQKIILAELNTEFGGSAKAFGASIPGSIERAKRSFEDFAESGVKAALPAILMITQAGARFAEFAAPYVEKAFQAIGRAAEQFTRGLTSGGGGGAGSAMQSLGAFARRAAAVFVSDVLPALRKVGAFIADDVMPVIRAFAGFIGEKVVPVAVRAARVIGEGLRSAFETIGRKIEENRPQLEKLGAVLKAIAEFIITKVYPVLARVLGEAIKVLGVAIGALIDTIGFLVDAFGTMARVGGNMAAAMIRGFRTMLSVALEAFGGIVHGAATALGWVPGVGDKLKEADSAFRDFKDKTLATLDAMAVAADALGEKTGTKLKEGFTRAVGSGLNTVVSVTPSGRIFEQASIPKRALGGPVTAGTPYVVGERRPELFVPNVGGRIMPRVPAATGPGAGIDYDRLAQAIMRALTGATLRVDAAGRARLTADALARGG